MAAPAIRSRAPIVLFIDPGFAVEPFADALAAELSCRPRVAPEDHGDVVGLVTGSEPVGLEQVAPFPELKLVLTCSTGTDHLDIAALHERGLLVCHTPSYCTREVADHALACLLAGWRGLWTLGDEVRAGRWNPSAQLRRFDSQRLGIVGLGRIGTELARRAQALRIDVVGCDPGAPAPAGVRLMSLPDLLSSSDAVSLHVPGAPGAPPLIGAEEIALMKPGALLLNLARASLVDLDALLAALRSGRLAGAAWDVWPAEPPAAGDERLMTPGLLVTPHVGWSSPEAELAYRAEAIATLRAALVFDQSPPGLVGEPASRLSA